MSKNISKGRELELLHSRSIHSQGTPLLISPRLLRKWGAGQVDIAVVKSKEVGLYEIKSSLPISWKQRKRLRVSVHFLSALFWIPVRLYLRRGLPKG